MALFQIALLLVFPAWAHAGDALETTTEFGITVTTDQIIDSMLEMEGFWPPVRAYIASDRFPVADAATRRESVEHLKALSRLLSARLASDDDSVGQDLAQYVAARLRKYECYRQLRAALKEDALTLRLKEVWERAMDECNGVPAGELQEKLQELKLRMEQEMQAAHCSAETIGRARPWWDRLAQTKLRIEGTSAGRAVMEYERQIESSSPACCELTVSVLDATEWALITKADGREITRSDFLAAWDTLCKCKGQGAASGSQGGGE
jgi:hypothetical protein